MNNLKGLFSALLVPFDERGQLNEAGLRQIIRHNIDKIKIDGLYVGGSTGENFLLDAETKKQIFAIAHAETAGKVALIAQIGTPNLYEAIDLGNYATKLGYDAISAVTPFYYKFNFSEVRQYYADICSAVPNRMIVYSIPFLTGVDMGLEQFRELFAIDNVIGVKFTAADFYLLERLRKHFPEKMIWSGFDEMLLPALMYKVDGAIGSTFNVNGHRARKIIEYVANKDLDAALNAQHEYNDFVNDVLANGLYPTLKQLLVLSGCDAGTFLSRKPMAAPNKQQLARATEIFQRYF